MVQRIKNKENLELLAEKIRQVDVVVIGGGSGLSSAAGYNHYHWMPYLEGQLQDFKEAYGCTPREKRDEVRRMSWKEIQMLPSPFYAPFGE